LPTYPLLTQLDANIQKNVALCRDREKTNRQDLNLLCTSFLINLKKRNEGFKNGGNRRLYEINEFCSVVRNYFWGFNKRKIIFFNRRRLNQALQQTEQLENSQ